MPEEIGALLKTKAVLWVAPYGEAQPGETSVAAGASWGGNWVKVGWTKAPLEFLYAFEEHDFEIEQALAPLDRQKIGESAMLETVLSENTALNLAYASGGDGDDVSSTSAGASQVAFDELEIGNDPYLEKWAVGFEGIKFDESENSLPVRYFFTRATININGGLTFSQKNDDYTGIPVQVKALADPSNNLKLFKWQRVTAPASS